MSLTRMTLLALAMLAGVPSFAGSEVDVWITLGREAVPLLQAAVSATGQPDSFTVLHDGEITVGRIRERQIPLLARLMHERFRRCGGFMVHPSEEVALREALRDAEAGADTQPLFDYTIDNGPVVQAMMGQLQEANVRSTISSLADSFFTRYHSCPSGQDSANWIKTLWQGYAQGRSDVTVELFSHPPSVTPQPSVILTIPGTIFPSEVVVLGAHQDSINGGNCANRSPGADDDGSGVASLSELIRVALSMDYRPKRTVKFMAYAAEEVGLRGSQDIATQYRNTDVNVVGVFQLDMTNYKGTPSADFAFVTDRTNAAQNTFVGQLVDVYLGLPRTNTQCGYGCSDHASWNAQGYAASFPFEAVFGQHNPWLHTAGDTLDKSGGNAAQALKFAKLATAYVAEMAKGRLGSAPPITRR